MSLTRRILLAATLGAAFLGQSSARADDVVGAHAFTFNSIDGRPLSLGDFAGKAVLVVNTASQCGFTPQYEELQALWEEYRGRGLVVLGVPSNDFGGQEPGSEAEIKQFCTANFAIDFPMTAKQRVKGPEAHPFYAWAGERAGMLGRPRWNFHKYLIGPDGSFAGWFASTTAPSAGRLRAAVEAALPEISGGSGPH